MIRLTINDRTVEVPEGSTILAAAESAGIRIPTLCYHKDLSPMGSCRLCVVEVEGSRLPMTSCNLAAAPGMVVRTETEKLFRFRQVVLKTLLYNYYDAGYTTPHGPPKPNLDSEFAYWVQAYGIDLKRAMAQHPRHPVDSDPNPYVWVDRNKCILCSRCVRACAEVQGRFVWAQAFRGFETQIMAGAGGTMLESRCESCGACVVYCPTGALDNKMSVRLGAPDAVTTTTCAYCGVGCQLDLNVKDGKVMRVTSNPAAPVNGLHLCVKGRYGYGFIHRPDRLGKPMVREWVLQGVTKPARRSRWVEVEWEQALDLAAERIKAAVETNGPGSTGIIASGKLLNEEYYLLNKLARQVIGTNNIDLGAHLQHAPLHQTLITALGAPAMTNTIADITQKARAMFVIGSNTTEQHPVLGAKVRQAILRGGLKMVSADTYPTNLEEYATLHLRYRAGTELALLTGLMAIMLENGCENREFIARQTTGWETTQAAIRGTTPAQAAETCGVPLDALYRAAEMLAVNRPMAVLAGMELSPAGLACLVNLQLMSGNLGIEGGGVNLLLRDSNTLGALDMGIQPASLPGYQPVQEPGGRAWFEEAWGRRLPGEAGLSAKQMLAAAKDGQLAALYIVNEDPVSMLESGPLARAALEACPFVMLQDVFSTETARYADLLLPGVTFAEKDGTFTNTERRIQRVRKAVEPGGEAREDWTIIAALARRLAQGAGQALEPCEHSGWEYTSTSQIMDEIGALTPIYRGVSHNRLDQGEALYWPVMGQEEENSPILRMGVLTGEGKGKFMQIEEETSVEPPEVREELALAGGS